MVKLTHIFAPILYKDMVFDNVNSYTELDNAILRYGGKDSKSEDYRQKTAMAFEVYNQYFVEKFGYNMDLDICDIIDMSASKFNSRYIKIIKDGKSKLLFRIIQKRTKNSLWYNFKRIRNRSYKLFQRNRITVDIR